MKKIMNKNLLFSLIILILIGLLYVSILKNSSYWLDSYKNWNEFCKSNYLDNWASNEAIKNNIYWESHIQKRQDVKFLKNDIDKFNLILKKINDLILYRGRIMYDELNKLI